MSASTDGRDPLLFEQLQSAGAEPASLLDAFYEMGDLGFLSAEAHEVGPLPVGTHFHALDSVGDGRDGLLLGGQAALYGEPWAGRNDPWDGP